MALLAEFRTIPQVYKHLTEELPKKHPHRQFLFHKVSGNWEGFDYEALKVQTESTALGLIACGVKRNDKVAIIAENRPEWIFSDLAILGLGAVNVPLYPSLTSDTIEFILNNSESVLIFVSNKMQLNKVMKVKDKLKYLKHIVVYNEKDSVHDDPMVMSFSALQQKGSGASLETFKNEIAQCSEHDVCTIIYTSGTTGEPKGVLLTHKNIVSNMRDAGSSFDFGWDDVFLSFLPLCHIFERMGGYYTAFSSGAKVYFAQSIESVAADLQDVKPTLMTAVPRLFERMHSRIMKNVDSQPEKKQKIFNWALGIGHEYCKVRRGGSIPIMLSLKHKVADKLVFEKLRARTGGRLKFFISGGAALPRELGEFFEAVGLLIIEGFGLTESSPVISANRPDSYKFGTVGKAFPSVEIKLAPDGEILARGPNIMQGYYKNKAETEAVLKDGWLHTGDLGVYDAEGFLMITDRKKNLFKTSTGKYVAPTPIENMFLASRYIDQFVLIGDRRMFLSALIVPDYDALREYADSHEIPYTDNDDLVKNQKVYDLMEKELVQFQKNLANFERIRKFALLEKPFTIESGELTPSLKVKRKLIEERYKNLIEEMYASLEKNA